MIIMTNNISEELRAKGILEYTTTDIIKDYNKWFCIKQWIVLIKSIFFNQKFALYIYIQVV